MKRPPRSGTRNPRSLAERHRPLRIESLEPRLYMAGDTYLINFQLAATPIPARYHADTGLVLGDRGGGLSFGWSVPHGDFARDRGMQGDQRLDTLIHFQQGEHWDLALPNGLYEVTVSIGDPQFGSTHTLNVEGNNYWLNEVLGPNVFRQETHEVMVTDGLLTLNQGAALDDATRINFIQVVGLPSGLNDSPSPPTITEPAIDAEPLNPGDVHMEAVNYFDPDGDEHKSTDWEIWTAGPSPELVWQTLGISGVERYHTHMGDGIFMNSHAGRTDLISSTVPNFDFNTYTLTIPGVTAGDHLTVVAEMIDSTGGGGSGISGMVDAFSLLSPTSQNLIDDGSFEAATANTQTSNSNWVMTTQHDGIELSAQFQSATWAASSGSKGVWFKGFRGTPGGPVDAAVTQVATATVSGSYTLMFDAKIEENFASVIGGFRVTITSDGTGGSQTIDLLNSISPEYELRVRYRDDEGSVSDPATRPFQVAPATTVFGLELEDIAASPAPVWTNAVGNPVILPAASPNQSQLRLEGGEGDLLLSIAGFNGISNNVTNPAELAHHVHPKVILTAGSNGLVLGETELAFTDAHGQVHTLYLPAINLGAGQRTDLWVAIDGSTYYGTPAQTEPDFSDLARQAELDVPFIAYEPGFVVEEVAGGLQLPVSIAFVPNPGPNPGDPLFYVNELYGKIKVVTNDHTVSDYATDLLNFNPTGAFPGSGELGLAGLVVDPVSGDLFVTRVTDSDGGGPSANLHPQVLRLHSNDGGLTASTITVIRNMVGETQGASHQVSNASIGPDGKLYIHVGDGFNHTTALNLNSYRGKILRMNLDGTAPNDNPFYDAGNGITARDFVYAYGFRNPFGGGWRSSDGKLYEVENGPSVDRFAQVNPGVSYGWDNSDASMEINAIYNWDPAHAPVNITFIQPSTFGGSQFPASMQDRAFVSESGATYATGPQSSGKRIVQFALDENGELIGGPSTLVEYVGNGKGSVVGLTAGPDGLYFTELYKDLNFSSPIEAGARVFRVRYVNPNPADYSINGVVDEADFLAWRDSFGSKHLLAADGNGNKIIDAGDYTIWRDALTAAEAGAGVGAGSAAVEASLVVASPATEPQEATSQEASANSIQLPFEFARTTRRLNESRAERRVSEADNLDQRQDLTVLASVLAREETVQNSHSSRSIWRDSLDDLARDRGEDGGTGPRARLAALSDRVIDELDEACLSRSRWTSF